MRSCSCIARVMAVAGGAALLVSSAAVTAVAGPADSSTGTVTGHVVGPKGVALSGADVFVGGTDVDAGGETTTAADGSFTVGNLPTGMYQVCASGGHVTSPSAGGYGSRCYGKGSGTPVHVTSGQSVTSLKPIALKPGAGVAGLVTDASTGMAVAGFGGGISQSRTHGKVSGLLAELTTASSGRYALGGLWSGAGTVCFGGGTGDASTTTAAPDGYVPTCATVSLAKGASRTAPTLSLAHGGSVSGTVTDGAGHPLSGVDVSVPGRPDAASTGDDGSYSILGVAPGSSVEVDFDGTYATSSTGQYGYGSASTTVSVTADEADTGVGAILVLAAQNQ